MDPPGPRDPTVRGRGFPRRPRGGHHANARFGRRTCSFEHGHRRRRAYQGPLLIRQPGRGRGPPQDLTVPGGDRRVPRARVPPVPRALQALLSPRAKGLSRRPRCSRHVRAAGRDWTHGRLDAAVRHLRRRDAPVVQPRLGHGHRTRPESAPPPGRTDPGPRDRPRDASDEPRQARLRGARDGHLFERDREGEGGGQGGRTVDRVPRGQRPQVQARSESRGRDHGPRGLPRAAERQAADLRADGPPGPPTRRLAVPEMLLDQGARHLGPVPPRGIGAPRILPRDIRDPVRRRDRLPGECLASPESPVRDLPSPRDDARGAGDSEARPEALDEVLIAHVGWHRLLDYLRRDLKDPLLARRPGAAGGLRDERDRVRFEVEPVLARGLVDLRRVREEAAVVEDLIEVPDEGAAVPEVHELPLEFSDERLDLRDPAVSVTADAVQFALRREADALLDQEELLRTAAPALDELVDAAGGRVDERRRGPVDQISRGEQVRAERRKAFPVEDPEDRPEDVVALHVRGAVERIEDHGESPASRVPPQYLPYHPSKWSWSFSLPP